MLFHNFIMQTTSVIESDNVMRWVLPDMNMLEAVPIASDNL